MRIDRERSHTLSRVCFVTKLKSHSDATERVLWHRISAKVAILDNRITSFGSASDVNGVPKGIKVVVLVPVTADLVESGARNQDGVNAETMNADTIDVLKVRLSYRERTQAIDAYSVGKVERIVVSTRKLDGNARHVKGKVGNLDASSTSKRKDALPSARFERRR